MRRILTITAMTAIMGGASAQDNIGRILREIEQNNTEIAALAKEAEAEKAENHSGLALENPEIEFGYLWGSPSAIGSRKDFSASQSLDMATLTGARKKAARSKDMLAEWRYKAGRMDILLGAQLTCIDIVYYNAVINTLEKRERTARLIAEAERQRLEAGDAGRMTYNEAMLDLKAVKAERHRNMAEREALLANLAEMNGGKGIVLTDTAYMPDMKSGDFNEWYDEMAQRSPALSYVRQDIETSRRMLNVSRMESLPKLSVGFSGEYVMGEKYQGVTVGMTIPLWGNKSRMRQAKAGIEAAEARQESAVRTFYGQLKSLYTRQKGLRETADMYAEALRETDNIPLLKKALSAGQISMTEYLSGAKLRYDAETQLLEAVREWQKAYAEMMAVTL